VRNFRRGAETVTRLRHADPVFPTMGDVTPVIDELDIDGCSVWPNTVTEKVTSARGAVTLDGQFTVLAGLTVFVPPGSDIIPRDQLRVRGIVYQVNGEPSVWNSPSTGRRAGIEVQLKSATG